MNFFKFLQRLQGYPIDKTRIALDEIRRLNERNLLQYQETMKWEIFNFHKHHNPWYNSVLSSDNITSWESIPILQKSDIQQPLDVILTERFKYKKLYKNNTSGSTGKPFHFAKDKFSHAMTWSYIFSCYENLGLEYGKSLQARFFGIPLSRQKYFKEKVKDLFSARVRFPVFDLSDKQLALYLNQFYKHKFEYIYGYTSSLVLFAKFLISKNIVLQKVCTSLKWCIVTSEVCSSDDRKVLERALGVNVINEYGAAELDIIAFEDREGDWLLNEENLFVEVIDEHGNPVKEGEEGNVVVTSLYNKAMPFIRYNLGDIISVWPERKGMYRRVKSMQGRMNDVAILPSGKKSPGLTFYYVSKSLLEEEGFLKEFTIKQVAIDSFHFEYVSSNKLTSAQKFKIMEMMDLYLEPNLKATFERKEKIERTVSGKFKHFQCLVNKPPVNK